MSIDRESDWILNQLRMSIVFLHGKGASTTTEEGNELSILKDDVKRFLELMHAEKLDARIHLIFIANCKFLLYLWRNVKFVFTLVSGAIYCYV